jgi:hypothetical protein
MMPDVLELVIGSSFTPDARLDLVICDATEDRILTRREYVRGLVGQR